MIFKRTFRMFFLAGLILLSVAGLSMGHALRISNARLVYDPAARTMLMTINFFADDFGAHLQKIYHQRSVDFANPSPVLHDLVRDYVSKKFILKINNAKQTLQLQSVTSMEDDIVQVKFALPITAGTHVQILEVYDELLFDAFNDQVNMLHVDLEGNETSYRFSQGDAHMTMKIDSFVAK